MDHDGHEERTRSVYWNVPVLVWSICAAVLLLPSGLVWLVRGVAMAFGCAPGPEECNGMAFGGGLRDTLAFAWSIATDGLVLVATAFVAAVAALFARKPLLAAASLLLLPIAAVVLPLLAVTSARYPGCAVSEAGIGSCLLWGASQGMSFHTAAMAQPLIYGFAPYSFALALMLGLFGWFFARPRHALPPRVEAHAMHRFHDERD